MSNDPDIIEIIIEPDVVPRGTIDLKALDAAPGTPAPRVRVTREGLVVPLGRKSGELEADEPVPAHIASLTPDLMAEVREAIKEAVDAPREPLETAPAEPEPVAADHSGLLNSALGGGSSSLVDAALKSEPPAEFAELEAAAEAPIPPRPKSARGTAPAPAAVPREYDHDFDTGLDSVSSFFDVAKVLLTLLLLTTGLVLLGMYLSGMWSGQEASVAQIDPPAEKTSRKVPIDMAPRKTGTAPVAEKTAAAPPAEKTEPKPKAAPKPIVTEVEKPKPDVFKPKPKPQVVEVEPDPKQVALERLRDLAAKATTGVEVGVEDELPGRQRKLQGLRARSARLIDAGNLADAEAAVDELLELSPNDPVGLLRKGLLLYTAGKHDAAITHYERSAQYAPKDPRPWNNLYLAKLAKGDRRGAKQSLKRALRLDPENPDVLTNLANLIAQKSPKRAHPLLDKAVLQNPKHEPARLSRAQVRERLGDRAGAQADYRVLLKGRLKAEALDGLGRLARKAGKPKIAVSFHRRALAKKEIRGARVNLGAALIDAKQYKQARAILEYAVKKEPKNAKAWQALAIAYAHLSEEGARHWLFKAKKAYERAIKLDRNNWVARFNYALCAERFGNFPVAIRQYEASIRLNPQGWQAYANLARMYQDTQRGERALQIIGRALKASPKEPELHLYRAYLLAKQKRRFDSRAALREYVRFARRDDPRLDRIRKSLTAE